MESDENLWTSLVDFTWWTWFLIYMTAKKQVITCKSTECWGKIKFWVFGSMLPLQMFSSKVAVSLTQHSLCRSPGVDTWVWRWCKGQWNLLGKHDAPLATGCWFTVAVKVKPLGLIEFLMADNIICSLCSDSKLVRISDTFLIRGG